MNEDEVLEELEDFYSDTEISDRKLRLLLDFMGEDFVYKGKDLEFSKPVLAEKTIVVKHDLNKNTKGGLF